jgi:hypothetical protein
MQPIPTALRNTDAALSRHGDFGRLWLDGMWRGDPLADAVVTDGAPLVRRAIAHGIDTLDDPPTPLVDLFAEIDTPPPWLDMDACDRACGHLARHHRSYGLVLGAASLLAGAQSTIAGKPLTFTGRYAADAAVRSIEVGSWLLSVTTPGGLLRRGEGFEHAVRVRMIHAHVRARLSRHPDWDIDSWGLPIPQPYTAFTLAEFCSVAMRAMRQLGVRYSERELPRSRPPSWRASSRRSSPSRPCTACSVPSSATLKRTLSLSPIPAGSDCRTLLSYLNRAGTAAYDACVPSGRARRASRGMRVRGREFEELRDRHAVSHQLVDDV